MILTTPPEPNWAGLAADLQGTTVSSISSIPLDLFARHNIPATLLDDDDLADEMLDQGIEMCDNCGTWVESGEIVLSEDGDPLGCDGCY